MKDKKYIELKSRRRLLDLFNVKNDYTPDPGPPAGENHDLKQYLRELQEGEMLNGIDQRRLEP